MTWVFIGSLLVIVAAAAIVTWPALAPSKTRWQALLVIQTPEHQQFYHKLTVRARTRKEAKVKALAAGARRWPTFGVQLDELEVL